MPSVVWLQLCPAVSWCLQRPRPAFLCLVSAAPSWNCFWKLAWLNLYCGPAMQRYPNELPVGFSNAHIAGGGQTFSWVCFTLSLSLSHELKHKQLSVFGILLCAFFLPLVFGLLSFSVPLPLSHRESPQTGNFIRQQIGGEKKWFVLFLGGH